MPLYRRTESGYAKQSVLFSMCKQSLQEGQQNPQIFRGMRDKTSTLGKFCSLSSEVCRLEILTGNRRGEMLMILLHCCSLFFTKTITFISLKLLSHLKEPTELSQRNPPLFPWICEWKHFASCHMLEEEHCIN